MPANERGSLKTAFAHYNRPESEQEAEMKLLGRTVKPESQQASTSEQSNSYPVATSGMPTSSSLIARPLLHREAVRQLSFRCPVSVAAELRKVSAFNQLEQQQIIIEGIKKVLAELPKPPEGWEDL